jgi:hypothetical protein
LPKQRLHSSNWQVFPKASLAVYPLIRSMEGFHDEIRPVASMVNTPSAMESIIRLTNRTFQISWILSVIGSALSKPSLRYKTLLIVTFCSRFHFWSRKFVFCGNNKTGTKNAEIRINQTQT